MRFGCNYGCVYRSTRKIVITLLVRINLSRTLLSLSNSSVIVGFIHVRLLI